MPSAPDWFLNKTGTRMLAASAAQQGVPVYVVATRDKFVSPAVAAAARGRGRSARRDLGQPACGRHRAQPLFRAHPARPGHERASATSACSAPGWCPTSALTRTMRWRSRRWMVWTRNLRSTVCGLRFTVRVGRRWTLRGRRLETGDRRPANIRSQWRSSPSSPPANRPSWPTTSASSSQDLATTLRHEHAGVLGRMSPVARRASKPMRRCEVVVDVSGVPAEAMRVLFREGVLLIAGEKAPPLARGSRRFTSSSVSSGASRAPSASTAPSTSPRATRRWPTAS